MPRIKETLAAGGVVRLFGIGQVPAPKLVEIVGENGGFDALWIDAEHGGLDMRDFEWITMAARAYDLDGIVRLPATDYASIMRPLEAGAGGVIISMVEDADHAEKAVRWAKFWPRGQRGLAGANRDARFGLVGSTDYVKQANERTFVGIQIETPGALEQVAEIAKIPDVDLVFVGPADLSQVLGLPGDFEHPKCLAAIERIAKACADAGKPWGIVPKGADYAERMLNWGCKMFVLGFDVGALHAGIRDTKQRYASFF